MSVCGHGKGVQGARPRGAWSLGAKISPPAPFVLRHGCFSQAGGILFSSVHTSVASLGHHYLLSGYLFPTGKENTGRKQAVVDSKSVTASQVLDWHLLFAVVGN